MRRVLKVLAQKVFKRCGIGITSYSRLEQLITDAKRASADDVGVLLELPEQHSLRFLKLMSCSKAQLRQDLFVLSELDFKTNGFFVEFGATNGIELSNTYLLEKDFGWTGILAEPAKRWHDDLKRNRTSCIETSCVWRDSKSSLTFNEVDVGELSTISSYSSSDHHHKMRRYGRTYQVETISLEHLLEKHEAPEEIDYLSIDTEGSEYDILSSFSFDRYSFKIITCEHNFGPQRERICSLLSKNGYMRKFEGISQFDDWYVKAR